MKPVLVLLVSTAWSFTGAQYYYQGLMDYLENRLLAIEVRSKHPFKWLITDPYTVFVDVLSDSTDQLEVTEIKKL